MPETNQNPLQGCLSVLQNLFGGSQSAPRPTSSSPQPAKAASVTAQPVAAPIPKKVEMPDIDVQALIRQSWEVAQNVVSSRTVVLNGQITDDTANRLIGHLLLLDRLSQEPIVLVLNSGGGQAYAGLAVYNTLKHLTAPLITVAGETCGGNALLLLLAGRKHYALAHSVMTYLTLTSGARGQPSDLVIQSQEIRRLQSLHNAIFQPFAFWDLGAVREFSAQEALDHKLIDGIVARIEDIER